MCTKVEMYESQVLDSYGIRGVNVSIAQIA